MGGAIRPDGNTDFIVSPHAMEIESSSVVVRPCWIDALLSSETYVVPTRFAYLHRPPSVPSVSFTQRPTSVTSVSLTQRTQRSRQRPAIRKLHLISEPHSQKAVRADLKRSNSNSAPDNVHKLDDFFTVKTRSQGFVARPPDPEPEIEDVVGIFEIERELPPRQPLRPPERKPVAPPIKKHELGDQLGKLCGSLLKSPSKPLIVEEEPGSEDKRSLCDQLTRFSQVDERQGESAFDVAYARENVVRPSTKSGERDPLFDLFQGSQAESV
jgi:hypothetical protein